MKSIPDKSVDVILCDLPYGSTPLSWDRQLDITLLWNEYKRIRKDTTPILLFGQEPFSSLLRCSNINEFKYDWYWEKERLTNVFQVKRRPAKVIECISVFYKKQCTYNPQKYKTLEKNFRKRIEGTSGAFSTVIAKNNLSMKQFAVDEDNGMRYPKQIIRIDRDNNRKLYHPTQKPISLLDYLIQTYTNEGDLVLDNIMGSGSTGVACMNTGRKFIGIEKEEKYFHIAEERIKEASNNLNKFME
jgi:site-specific DNA-methyltransferase (adenine-specific)